MSKYINSGNFRKGMTPHNKGKKGACFREEHTQKGVQGFLPRPVVVLNHDGSVIAEYPSVGACAEALGCDRHSVTDACKGKYLCRGYKIMYADDWSPLGDYRYRPTRGRGVDGELLPGHGLSRIYSKRKSPETRERMRRIAAETARRMCDDPSNPWGKGTANRKKVWCCTSGETFNSIREAAAHFGIPPYYISAAMGRNGTTRGLKFYTTR